MKKQASETRIVLSLASIFSFRMLGLFMLLPVFTLYANTLPGASHALLGVAFGIYGLTQAILQIPLGTLSDKYGRKPVITIGLIIFALGSILGAFAHNIWVMIAARALQGSGAVGSTLIALMADLTKEKNRTKAMATLGMFIGCSFAIAFVVGPIIARAFGLAGIFWFIALLACLGIVMVHTIIPTPDHEQTHADSTPIPALFKQVLRDPELLRLDCGIFFQHAIFTSVFYVLPLLLAHRLPHQWLFYLPIMLVSFSFAVPLMIFAEKKQQVKPIFISAIVLLLISQLLLIGHHAQLTTLASLLFLFFCGFNILEAMLPSMISKIAPLESKGTAMGIYSSSQFLGIFVGGSLAGILYQNYQTIGVFCGNALLALLWLTVAMAMKKPQQHNSKLVPMSPSTDDQQVI